MRKAQLSMNVIIIAAISLLVLVIISVLVLRAGSPTEEENTCHDVEKIEVDEACIRDFCREECGARNWVAYCEDLSTDVWERAECPVIEEAECREECYHDFDWDSPREKAQKAIVAGCEHELFVEQVCTA